MLWGYANLAKHLGEDYPVFVFNSPAPRELGNESIEQIARRYVQELRAFQPEGPYHLGGYCFGGEVAFEMAQQLSAAGQKVGMLVVMNSMPPNSNYERIIPTPGWLIRFGWNSWHWFRHFCRWKPQERRSFIQRKARLACKLIKSLANKRDKESIESTAEDQIDVSLYSDDQRRLWDIHLRASANYKPAPYSGRITVFRTGFHPFFCSFDRSYGWSEFAHGGLDVRIVRGTHESILDEPYVGAVATELKRLYPDAADGNRGDSRLEKVGQVVVSSCLWLVEFAPAL